MDFAVIFDMDGVISDTQKIHAQVESEILFEQGIYLTPSEITMRFAGVKTEEFFRELIGQEKKLLVDELMNKKWEKMALYAREGVDEIEGSIELIKMLFALKIKMAVASASNSRYVTTILSTLGVLDYFPVVVSGDCVKKGKPDPESFLLAAQKLQVKPEYCVVIEDGRSGMIAAKAGGMKCIGLVSLKDKSYLADLLVTSLKEIDARILSTLINSRK